MDESRAQTNPVAVALLTGLVVTGALTVVVFGGGVIDEVSNSAATERAAQEMTQFASETAAVALGGSERRRVDFSATEGTLTTQPDASWICIQNGTADDRQLVLPESDDSSETCEDDRTAMGAAVYDTGDGRVAYEGGGVWTSDTDGNSRMVSPPEFHYRGETLTLPVVQLDGDVRASGPQVGLVATAGATDRVDISNPLPEDSGSVYVTVGSEFYQAWGRFIAERTDGRVVELDHDAETVSVELVVPSPVTIDNAIQAGGDGSGAIKVQNLSVDSYDSTTHSSYSSSNANDDGAVITDGGVNPIEGTVGGNVYTIRRAKKVKIASTGRVNGSVHSQRKVEVAGSGVVEGDIFAEQKVMFKGEEVGGTVHSEEQVELSSSGVSVGGVRTGSELRFKADGVTVDGDVHAEELKNLGKDPTLNGDVFTNGTYGKQGNGVGVAVPGDLHASGGINTDDTTVSGAAYTDGDFEDTDSDYNDEVHVGGDADLSGTEGSETVYVAGNAELGSATINDEIHVGGDLTCSGSNTVTGSVNVDGTVVLSIPAVPAESTAGRPESAGVAGRADPRPPQNRGSARGRTRPHQRRRLYERRHDSGAVGRNVHTPARHVRRLEAGRRPGEAHLRGGRPGRTVRVGRPLAQQRQHHDGAGRRTRRRRDAGRGQLLRQPGCKRQGQLHRCHQRAECQGRYRRGQLRAPHTRGDHRRAGAGRQRRPGPLRRGAVGPDRRRRQGRDHDHPVSPRHDERDDHRGLIAGRNYSSRSPVSRPVRPNACTTTDSDVYEITSGSMTTAAYPSASLTAPSSNNSWMSFCSAVRRCSV
ncbi:hypothetical protein BRC75_08650 [Halobacteriales archaeon QH_7_69_31]|nr:MAG: hypothetical protein BRC75_08650 [Halobacteriales archaeon QH_7_69_31]